MHVAVRSTLGTGVALVGAGAIAISPVSAGPVAGPLSSVDVPAAVSAASVELAASFDPLTPWVDVITAAVSNVATIGEDWLANPLPAVRQIGNNWLGYADTTATALGGAAEGAWTYLTSTVPDALSTAFQEIVNGDISGAATTINGAISSALFTIGLPLFPVVAIPGEMADNFAAVVSTVIGIPTLLPLVAGVLGPVEGGIQAFGDTAQDFVDAVQASDAGAAIQALWDTVPNTVGAVVNGYSSFPGLLSPTDGLVHALVVTIPQAIATALGASAPVMALSAPAASTKAAEPAATGAETSTGSGEAQSQRAVASTAASEDGTTAASPAAATTDSATPSAASAAADKMKSGNKFEPAAVSPAGSAAKSGATSGEGSASSGSKATSASGSSKGHSARHAS